MKIIKKKTKSNQSLRQGIYAGKIYRLPVTERSQLLVSTVVALLSREFAVELEALHHAGGQKSMWYVICNLSRMASRCMSVWAKCGRPFLTSRL